jgi:hypothetical protein
MPPSWLAWGFPHGCENGCAELQQKNFKRRISRCRSFGDKMTKDEDPLSSYPDWVQEKFQSDWLIFKEMIEESDRVTAVIGGATVDEALGAAIKSRLQDCPETDWLLIPSNPLGSFGARIALAHAMRITGPKIHQDLLWIKDIRNAFAHMALIRDSRKRLSNLNFKTQKINDICNNLWCAKETLSKKKTLPTDAKTRFVITALHIKGQLWNETCEVVPKSRTTD